MSKIKIVEGNKMIVETLTVVVGIIGICMHNRNKHRIDTKSLNLHLQNRVY